MSNVNFQHSLYKKYKSLYKTISDCLEGEVAIKRGDTIYLPQPNATDTSDENSLRYLQYKKRAIFYNATGKTVEALTGQVFINSPKVELHPKLEPLLHNIDNCGKSAIDLAKEVIFSTVSKSRCGIFVDFPTFNTSINLRQIDSILPFMQVFEAEQIINFRTVIRNGVKRLSLVVIEEKYFDDEDDFESSEQTRYKVLRLGRSKRTVNENNRELFDDDVYTVEKWEKGKDGGGWEVETYQPTDVNGKKFTEIPFYFVGSKDNEAEPNYPIMYDMAVLNIGHYRNSADLEESSFFVGQPTPYFSGLTQTWVETVFKNKTVELGVRAAVPLPEGGSAGLLQPDPNIMPKDLMELKERQMVALGAKLIEQKQVQRTATEASMESFAEKSVLTSIVDNANSALKKAFDFAQKYVSSDEADNIFQLNKDFHINRMSPEERRQTVEEWMQGAVTFTEMRENLSKGGYTHEADEIAMRAMEEDRERKMLAAQQSVIDNNQVNDDENQE